jgi:hypothetical protein
LGKALVVLGKALVVLGKALVVLGKTLVVLGSIFIFNIKNKKLNFYFIFYHFYYTTITNPGTYPS